MCRFDSYFDAKIRNKNGFVKGLVCYCCKNCSDDCCACYCCDNGACSWACVVATEVSDWVSEVVGWLVVGVVPVPVVTAEVAVATVLVAYSAFPSAEVAVSVEVVSCWGNVVRNVTCMCGVSVVRNRCGSGVTSVRARRCHVVRGWRCCVTVVVVSVHFDAVTSVVVVAVTCSLSVSVESNHCCDSHCDCCDESACHNLKVFRVYNLLFFVFDAAKVVCFGMSCNGKIAKVRGVFPIVEGEMHLGNVVDCKPRKPFFDDFSSMRITRRNINMKAYLLS